MLLPSLIDRLLPVETIGREMETVHTATTVGRPTVTSRDERRIEGRRRTLLLPSIDRLLPVETIREEKRDDTLLTVYCLCYIGRMVVADVT